MGHRDDLARLTPALRRFASALIPREGSGPNDAAAEMVHRTLALALKTGRQPAADQLRIWLYTTLIHLNQARLQALSEAGGAPPASPAPRSQGVNQALLELPLSDREALLLVVIEGFTYAQSAEILGISRATLVCRIARARALLGQHLDAALPFGARRHLRQPNHLRLVK